MKKGMKELSRRDWLAAAGALGVGAAAAYAAPRSALASDYATLVRDFARTLSTAQHRAIFLPWQHPSRQLVNTVAILKNPHLGTLLTAEQLPYVWAMFRHMQSSVGVPLFAQPVREEAGGLVGCVMNIYGDPIEGPCQTVLSGGHLQIRGGDRLGGSFVDGIAYGHQIGNFVPRVAGNAWAFHSAEVNAFFRSLTASQRRQAIVARKPYELDVQLQGASGDFHGLPVSELGYDQSRAFQGLLVTLLSAYPEQQVAAALTDIEAAGGWSALHLALYAEHGYFEDGQSLAQDPERQGELPYFQVWRIEGPGAVIHHEGYPHVHAYVHIAGDPEQQAVGAQLADLEKPLRGETLRRFQQAGLARAGDADVGFYPGQMESHLPRGPLTEGLVWTLDPFGNDVMVVEIDGDKMGDSLKGAVAEQAGQLELGRTYRVATSSYRLRAYADDIGSWRAEESAGTTVREALVEHVRQGGLADAQVAV